MAHLALLKSKTNLTHIDWRFSSRRHWLCSKWIKLVYNKATAFK